MCTEYLSQNTDGVQTCSSGITFRNDVSILSNYIDKILHTLFETHEAYVSQPRRRVTGFKEGRISNINLHHIDTFIIKAPDRESLL